MYNILRELLLLLFHLSFFLVRYCCGREFILKIKLSTISLTWSFCLKYPRPFNVVLLFMLLDMAVPEVDKKLLGDLESMGFPRARATRALYYSGQILWRSYKTSFASLNIHYSHVVQFHLHPFLQHCIILRLKYWLFAVFVICQCYSLFFANACVNTFMPERPTHSCNKWVKYADGNELTI